MLMLCGCFSWEGMLDNALNFQGRLRVLHISYCCSETEWILLCIRTASLLKTGFYLSSLRLDFWTGSNLSQSVLIIINIFFHYMYSLFSTSWSVAVVCVWAEPACLSLMNLLRPMGTVAAVRLDTAVTWSEHHHNTTTQHKARQTSSIP